MNEIRELLNQINPYINDGIIAVVVTKDGYDVVQNYYYNKKLDSTELIGSFKTEQEAIIFLNGVLFGKR